MYTIFYAYILHEGFIFRVAKTTIQAQQGTTQGTGVQQSTQSPNLSNLNGRNNVNQGSTQGK